MSFVKYCTGNSSFVSKSPAVEAAILALCIVLYCNES